MRIYLFYGNCKLLARSRRLLNPSRNAISEALQEIRKCANRDSGVHAQYRCFRWEERSGREKNYKNNSLILGKKYIRRLCAVYTLDFSKQHWKLVKMERTGMVMVSSCPRHLCNSPSALKYLRVRNFVPYSRFLLLLILSCFLHVHSGF